MQAPWNTLKHLGAGRYFCACSDRLKCNKCPGTRWIAAFAGNVVGRTLLGLPRLGQVFAPLLPMSDVDIADHLSDPAPTVIKVEVVNVDQTDTSIGN